MDNASATVTGLASGTAVAVLMGLGLLLTIIAYKRNLRLHPRGHGCCWGGPAIVPALTIDGVREMVDVLEEAEETAIEYCGNKPRWRWQDPQDFGIDVTKANRPREPSVLVR